MAEKPPSHADFLLQLHSELLALRDEDFASKTAPVEATNVLVGTAYVPKVQRMSHSISPTDDRVRGGAKRRTRVCTVCSVLSDGRYRKHETTYYCIECSDQQKCKYSSPILQFTCADDSHCIRRPDLLVQCCAAHGHRQRPHQLPDLAQSLGRWGQVAANIHGAHPAPQHDECTDSLDADALRRRRRQCRRRR